MKKIVLLFVLITNYALSQSINDYQYVMVPAKFDIFKEKDKYNLNTTVKLLLQKYGFKAYFPTDAIPDEVANSNCKKLNADLIKDNNLLSTKVKIVLKDCRDSVVYETAFGKSTEKDYGTAYMEAIRNVAKSFESLNYHYNGKNGLNTEPAVIEAVAPSNNASPEVTSGSDNTVFYFAQPITNGFQIIDNEPKVIMKIFNTSVKNVFIGIKGGINGVVISKNGEWFFEYYENNKLVSELLKLKF